MKKISEAKFVFVDANLYMGRDGNTVHKVTVYLSPDDVMTSTIKYGYGTHYRKTVGDMLFNAGFLKNEGYDAWAELREQIHIFEQSRYVNRKKDL